MAALRHFGFYSGGGSRGGNFDSGPALRLLARPQIGLWTRFRDLILQHSVENAVNESARLGGAIPLGQLKRLVDGNLGRYLGAEQHLVGAEAERLLRSIAAIRSRSRQFSATWEIIVSISRLMLLDAVDQPLL